MTAINLVVELEKTFSFQGHSIERRRLEALALIRLYAKKAVAGDEKPAPNSMQQLYTLVEAYLCTPNTSPAVKDAYDNLVAWFVRNKRPDGSEPLPVSSEQL